MARPPRAIVDYTTERDAAIIPLSKFIIESMTGNADFPEPTPTLSTLQALLDSYAAALSEAAIGDRNKIAVKKELRSRMNNTLNQLGTYVNMVSAGNIAKMISSGFNISKPAQPRHISAPENLVVKRGINPGTLVSKVKADRAATGYIHMFTTAPVTENSVWTSISSSRCQYKITNLQPHTQYAVKVAVIGTKRALYLQCACKHVYFVKKFFMYPAARFHIIIPCVAQRVR